MSIIFIQEILNMVNDAELIKNFKIWYNENKEELIKDDIDISDMYEVMEKYCDYYDDGDIIINSYDYHNAIEFMIDYYGMTFNSLNADNGLFYYMISKYNEDSWFNKMIDAIIEEDTENYIYNNVKINFLKYESNFIEQFIHDVRFNNEIHIYKDMVIIEKENKILQFNHIYNYSNKKYDKFKDELDLLVCGKFNELKDKYIKDKNDKYIEIPLEQSDIYGDKYKSKLTINFIDNEDDFKEIKKIWVDNYY